MNDEDGRNWDIDWGIVYGETDPDVNSKNPGGTAADYTTATIHVRIQVSAFNGFPDGRIMALVLGHELVHALDIANGNELEWIRRFPNQVKAIMEYHAWEWTSKAEQDPRINTTYGLGASHWMNFYQPQLPDGFSFKHYNR